MAWITAGVLGALGAAALSGGTSLVGSILNYKSQKKANEINEKASDRAIAQYIFTLMRHRLRIKLCRRLNIEPTESNIAVMESIEYQTV